jgi:hypothetical protein
VLSRVGVDASVVGSYRQRLILELRQQIRPQDVVAAVDVGWVGAAHEGEVVDLAGVTDLRVAGLPGGHTTKRIPDSLFRRRKVTKVLLLLPQGVDDRNSALAQGTWKESSFARPVESRVAVLPTIRKNFSPAGIITANPNLRYLLLTREGR